MGIYSKTIFPFLMDFVCSNRQIGKHRKDLLQSVQGKILEIGFGTGVNLEYYPSRVQAINVVEPNTGMHRKAAKRMANSKIKVGISRGVCEKLPFENQIFDSVVSTFTLCSIADVELALWELHRVLKPTGKIFFLEHGLSDDVAIAKKQRRFTPWQRRIADGCSLDRNIEALVSGAGFKITTLKKYYFTPRFKMFTFLYQGEAQKMGRVDHR